MFTFALRARSLDLHHTKSVASYGMDEELYEAPVREESPSLELSSGRSPAASFLTSGTRSPSSDSLFQTETLPLIFGKKLCHVSNRTSFLSKNIRSFQYIFSLKRVFARYGQSLCFTHRVGCY